VKVARQQPNPSTDAQLGTLAELTLSPSSDASVPERAAYRVNSYTDRELQRILATGGKRQFYKVRGPTFLRLLHFGHASPIGLLAYAL
jgi:hypothetical protein